MLPGNSQYGIADGRQCTDRQPVGIQLVYLEVDGMFVLINDLGKRVVGAGGISAHSGSLIGSKRRRSPRDSSRRYTKDGGILETASHIGSVLLGVAVVFEPVLENSSVFLVGLLVSHSYGAEYDAELLCDSTIVSQHLGIRSRESRIGGICPVDRQNNDCIRVGAIFTNILHPCFHAAAETAEVGARFGSLLLENNMRPCLCADEHTCRGRTCIGQSLTLIVVVLERLTEIGMGSPRGVLALGGCHLVEHIVLPLVLVVDKRVVHRQYLDLGGLLGKERGVRRPKCDTAQDRIGNRVFVGNLAYSLCRNSEIDVAVDGVGKVFELRTTIVVIEYKALRLTCVGSPHIEILVFDTFDGFGAGNLHTWPCAVEAIDIAPHIEGYSVPTRLVENKDGIAVVLYLVSTRRSGGSAPTEREQCQSKKKEFFHVVYLE